MLVNVRVVTQVFENKAFGEIFNGGEHTPVWKPKGAQVFNMPIDSDDVMYADYLVTAIETVLKDLGNDLYTYEYLEHDIEFKEPITVPQVQLTNALVELQQ